MIMLNGQTTQGFWRLDEVRADGPVGMDFLMNPFALVPKQENAERIVQVFRLLREWMDTPFFEKKEDFDKWKEQFRPRVEAALKPE